MAFDESDCSVLSESHDDFQSDLDHEYDTCSDDYFTDHNSIVMGTMATIDRRNLIRYVLPLLRVSMCTCHGVVCKNARRR
jgi:hypothetical protein